MSLFMISLLAFELLAISGFFTEKPDRTLARPGHYASMPGGTSVRRRQRNDQERLAGSSANTLATDAELHPIGKIQPL